MKRYAVMFGIRTGLCLMILGGLYAGLVAVPHLRANRPLGNQSMLQVQTKAAEILALLTALEAPRGKQPADAYVFSTLLATLKQQRQAFKDLNAGKLAPEDQNVLKAAISNMESLVNNDLVVVDKYNKILAYYPESDLYSQDIPTDIALQRTDEAARNLRGYLSKMDGSISSQPLQSVVTCLDKAKNSYVKDACVPEYANLRSTAMQDIINQLQSAAHAKQLKEHLNNLLH